MSGLNIFVYMERCSLQWLDIPYFNANIHSTIYNKNSFFYKETEPEDTREGEDVDEEEEISEEEEQEITKEEEDAQEKEDKQKVLVRKRKKKIEQ